MKTKQDWLYSTHLKRLLKKTKTASLLLSLSRLMPPPITGLQNSQ